jgi:hypothetical protein
LRKEIDVTIDDGSPDTNRDFGKVFHVREMPAMQAEKWATRALLAVSRSGIDIGEVIGGGMQGIAVLGLKALASVNFYEVEPLLDEMMACITLKPDINKPNFSRAIVDGEIEEVRTLIKLREEVLRLHVDFSAAGSLSRSTSETPATPMGSSTIPTSPEPSVRFSRQARRR